MPSHYSVSHISNIVNNSWSKDQINSILKLKGLIVFASNLRDQLRMQGKFQGPIV